MTAEPALRRILAEARACIAATPPLAAFCADLSLDAHSYAPLAPRDLPALVLLPQMRTQAAPGTQALADAILDAAPRLSWRQSYTEAQVGADYLRRYGWFNLAAPSGPFVSQETRISIGYFDAGLVYPRHWHRAAETYFVIAGSAVFQRDGAPDALLGPGETYENPPRAVHAAIMKPGPLLTLAIWTGEGLDDTPTFVDRP
jgi:mannose-6-phosphate isomerase-like protein (cupin superfamily)